MTEIVYAIKHRPDGKWMLEHGLSSYGPFNTHAEALDGLQRLRVPEIYTYDKDGVQT